MEGASQQSSGNQVVTFGKTPDPDIPNLRQAKAEYAKLQ